MRKKKTYICEKCGYNTIYKSHYISHLSRLTPCNKKKKCNLKTYKNLEIEEKTYKYQIKELLIKLKQSNKESEKLKLEKTELNNKLEKKDKNIDDLIKTNKMLAKQATDYKETININMTMNNYINVNAYGKENLKYINMQKLLTDYKSLAQMVAKQIQLKHFSKYKENHNIILERKIYKTYNNEGIWETNPKYPNSTIFIANELIKKGVDNIDDYKKTENIKFEKNKEKTYRKDKKYLRKNIALSCMFNPSEATKRLKEIQEQRKIDSDPKDKKWDEIEKKYKKEIKTAKKQLDVKDAFLNNLKESIEKKNIKAGMVKFKNY